MTRRPPAIPCRRRHGRWPRRREIGAGPTPIRVKDGFSFTTAIEEIDGMHVFYDMGDARSGITRPDGNEEAGRGGQQEQSA